MNEPAPIPVNILMVDDEPANLRALSALLEDMNLNLVPAKSGEEALRHLLQRDFALVLLDVFMPDMDGFETAALIRQRERCKHTPIVFLTAVNKLDIHVFRGYSLGAVDYIIKPIVPEVLRSKVAVFADLARKTEQVKRQAEEVRSGLETQLRGAQRMEAVGRMAAGCAHDFRNFITAILGYTSVLLARMQKDDPLRPEVEEIVAASKRADALTRQLAGFGKAGGVLPRPLDLNAVLGDLEGMLRRLVHGKTTLSLWKAATLPRVLADGDQMGQVLLNLVINALDAMPEGGTLTIETTHMLLDGAALCDHPGTKPGEYVCLSVRDTGVGMAPEVRRRLFEPFFTTKEPSRGTGLGLSTALGIVRQAGGYIHVDTEPRRGSTFKVFLPAWEAVPNGPLPRGPAQAAAEGMTLLLAEDDHSLRKHMADALRTAGFRVLEASEATEAMQVCKAHTGRIGLMILDSVPPFLAPEELVPLLHRLHPEARVLLASASACEEACGEEVAVLRKPFTPEELVRRVKEILRPAP